MEFRKFLRDLFEGEHRKRVLSSPLTYQLVERALKLARGSFPSQASYMMARFALAQTGRAFSRKVPVVWTSAFFPVEIVWGLNLCPFSPEVAAAFLASLGFAEEALDRAEQAGYSRDLCSFHRLIVGAALLGYLPPPAALVASTHLCDGAPLLFQNLAAFFRVPFHVLDVPYRAGRDAEAYVAEQLAELWRVLADLAEQKPEPAGLAEAIQNSNRFRANLLEVNELRCRVPAPVRGSEMLNYLYLFFAGQGSREAAEVFACLAREIGRGEREGKREERFRILWLHLKPFYKGELMDFIENKSGAVLAFEEMSHVYWPPLSPGDPFPGLARKVLSHFCYKPLEARTATVKRLAEKYRVDGIVHFSHWGCRQSVGGSLMLKDALQRAGWPVLLLDGDCLDARNEATGGMLTRVQAFLEILAERKNFRVGERHDHCRN